MTNPGTTDKEALLAASWSSLDAFLETLLLQDGLAENTLKAYRRDASACAQFLAERGVSLDGAQTQDLQAWQAQRAAQGAKATSSNRGLSVLRRYYHWALQEQRLQHDPSVLLLAAKRPPRVPHVLSEAQVEQLLAAPDTSTPLGLRDRAMLELLYASG